MPVWPWKPVLIGATTLVWLVLVFWLSALPNPTIPLADPESKLVPLMGHFVMYGILAFLVFCLLASLKGRGILLLLAAIVVASAYGALMEWYQSFIPGRTPSVEDMFVNGVGAVSGTVVIYISIVLWPWASRLWQAILR